MSTARVPSAKKKKETMIVVAIYFWLPFWNDFGRLWVYFGGLDGIWEVRKR